jgi:nitroreductase
VFIDLLRSRRSIRTFAPRPVEPDKVDLLIEAALRSPSSRGKSPWLLVVVTDPALIAQLATAKPHGSALLRGAPLVVVVCGDPSQSDVWIEDAAIVATLLHLEAHDLGLGSCWVQIRLRRHDDDQMATEYVSKLLGLEEGTAVEALVAIGYPAERKTGHPESSLPYEKVVRRTQAGA